MAGVIGKGNKSYIKQRVSDSLLPDFGISVIKWAHVVEVAVTDPTISFLALNLPVTHELRQQGFANPTSSRITALGVANFRNNLTVTSNLNGVLFDYVTYNATDNSIIFRDGYTVEAGEYFIFEFDQNVETGNKVVNARPLRKTAIIPSGRRRFSIGTSIEIASSIINVDGTDSQQIGNVQVYAEGRILFRNPGNTIGNAATSGNYREVFLDNITDAGIESATVIDNGTANAIELNEALTQDADTMIISTNLIVDSIANTISTLTNEAANKLNEFPALEVANAAQFLRVDATGEAYELVGGLGGHTIEDGAGTDFAQRTNLQFVGPTITDDSANDRTVVNIQTLYQRKVSSITGGQTGAIITFNNLTLNATYRATAYFDLADVTANGNSAEFQLLNGTTPVSNPVAVNNPGESNRRMMFVSEIFVAENAARTLSGNLISNTYDTESGMVITLEELSNYAVTTQWT